MTEGMNVKDYDYDLPEELIAQDGNLYLSGVSV